jgi:hypothetical protein
VLQLEDRTVPVGSLGPDRYWLLQVDGVTGPAAQQLQEVQQRLDATGVQATAVRHLGLDGLALIDTSTEQTYPALQPALSTIPGYRYVRANSLGQTPLFLPAPSFNPPPVPGEWVVQFDGYTGSAAAQEQQARLWLAPHLYGWTISVSYLGRDGVFLLHTDPGRTAAEVEEFVRHVPTFRRLEPNTVGWVATFLRVDPEHLGADPAVPGQWLTRFDGVTGTRQEQKHEVQRRLDAAGANATVLEQLGSDGLVALQTDPRQSYEDLDRALSAVPGYRGDVAPNYRVYAASAPAPTRVLVTAADAGGGPHVLVHADLDQDGAPDALTASFMAFDPAFRGGVRVAMGDFDGDGHDELVTAAGPGGGPHIKVWTFSAVGAVTGPTDSFFAFDPRFGGGAWVTTGDFDRDGRDELVVSADAGGGPHVRIYSDTDGDGQLSDNLVDEFFAFDPAFPGGARVAVLGYSDRDQLVVSAGPGGAPHVKVYANRTLDRRVSDEGVLKQFFAFDPSFTGGAFIAANRTGRSAGANLAVSAGAGGGPHVKLYLVPGPDELVLDPLRDSFFAYDLGSTGGVRVAFSDLAPNDPSPDVLTATGPGGRSLVKVWSGDAMSGKVSDQPVDDSFAVFRSPDGEPLDFGVFVASGTT